MGGGTRGMMMILNFEGKILGYSANEMVDFEVANVSLLDLDFVTFLNVNHTFTRYLPSFSTLRVYDVD